MSEKGFSRIIHEHTVDTACEAVAQLSDAEARREIERLFKVQPALVTFVMATVEDLSKDGQELGLYMFVVIHRMYELQFGKRLQNVGLKRVESTRDSVEAAMEKLAGTDEARLEQAVMVQFEKQPAVGGYVAEALFEPDDESIELSEEDQGQLFLTMKIVIDCLDSSIREH